MRLQLVCAGFLAALQLAAADLESDQSPTEGPQSAETIAEACMGPLEINRAFAPERHSRLILAALGKFGRPHIDECRAGHLPPAALSPGSATRLAAIVREEPGDAVFPEAFGATVARSDASFFGYCRQIPVRCNGSGASTRCAMMAGGFDRFGETGGRYAGFIEGILRNPGIEGHTNYTTVLLAAAERLEDQPALQRCRTGDWLFPVPRSAVSDGRRAPAPFVGQAPPAPGSFTAPPTR